MFDVETLLKCSPEAVERLARFVGAPEPSEKNPKGRRFRMACNVIRTIKREKAS